MALNSCRDKQKIIYYKVNVHLKYTLLTDAVPKTFYYLFLNIQALQHRTWKIMWQFQGISFFILQNIQKLHLHRGKVYLYLRHCSLVDLTIIKQPHKPPH